MKKEEYNSEWWLYRMNPDEYKGELKAHFDWAKRFRYLGYFYQNPNSRYGAIVDLVRRKLYYKQKSWEHKGIVQLFHEFLSGKF